MFSQIRKIAIAASLGTALTASAAIAAEEPLVFSNIDVDVSYSGTEGANTEQFYPAMAEDLKLALLERLRTSDDTAMPAVYVDVRRVALDGDTVLPDSAEFNEIEGVVRIESPTGTTGGLSFPVTVTARTGDAGVTGGAIVVSPDADDFYRSMVAAFADAIVEGAANVNTAGDKINR